MAEEIEAPRFLQAAERRIEFRHDCVVSVETVVGSGRAGGHAPEKAGDDEQGE